MSWPKKAVEFSFYLVFFLVPLIFLPSTSELFEFNKIIVTYVLTTLIVTFWLCRMVAAKKIIFRRTLLDLPLLLFLASQFISLIFSIDPRTSLMGYYSRFNGGFLSLLSYSLLYWAYVSNMDRKSTLSTIRFSLIAAILVSFWGVAEHFGADAGWWVQDVKHRVFSTLGQPNWLAAYLIALVFIPLSLILNLSYSKSPSQRYLQIGYWFVAFLLILVLIYTKSRSGMLAFGLSSLVYWSLVFKQYKFKVKNYFLVFVVICAALFLLISNPLRDQLLPASGATATPEKAAGPALEIGGTESGNIRKIVWTGAIRIWQSSPKTFWLGTGPETFAESYYQFRPIEHNSTSEWELLYNKAHNEFLNYLATTGLLGLGTYLLLLAAMLWTLIKSLNSKSLEPGKWDLLLPALLAGWLTIPVTNFWGFSVVFIQILLFLLPGWAICLSSETPLFEPAKNLSYLRMISILFLLLVMFYPLYAILKYWSADAKYAAGQKSLQTFSATSEPAYLLDSYSSLFQAYQLNPDDPPIASDLSIVSAYLSVLSAEVNATKSADLSKLAIAASNQAVSISPHHPNYYKSRARVYILLGTLHPEYLKLADESLAAAQLISPTDPRLPYNRGLVATYMKDNVTAAKFFKAALALKPDFPDALAQMAKLASPSAAPL